MEAFVLLDASVPGSPVVAVGGDLEALTGSPSEELLGRSWQPPADGGRGAAAETDVRMIPLDGSGRLMLYRLRAAAGTSEDVTFLAFHDRLTGLPNRTLLERHLAMALPRALRKSCSVVVLFIDLDRFKEVNDRLGHAAGDEILREAARRLGDAVRTADLVARLGGDEFVLVLTDVDGDAAATAELVATHVDQALVPPIVVSGGHRCYVGASIGLSTFPKDGTDSASLLASADARMYREKRRRGGAPTLNPSTELGALVARARSVEHDLAMTRRTHVELREETNALVDQRAVRRFPR